MAIAKKATDSSSIADAFTILIARKDYYLQRLASKTLRTENIDQ